MNCPQIQQASKCKKLETDNRMACVLILDWRILVLIAPGSRGTCTWLHKMNAHYGYLCAYAAGMSPSQICWRFHRVSTCRSWANPHMWCSNYQWEAHPDGARSPRTCIRESTQDKAWLKPLDQQQPLLKEELSKLQSIAWNSEPCRDTSTTESIEESKPNQTMPHPMGLQAKDAQLSTTQHVQPYFVG